MSFTIVEQAPARLNRSELAVPGSNPKLFEKAAASAADVVFLDLEDAVAPDDKEQARKNNYKGFSADHVHEIQIGGHTTSRDNLQWMTSRANSWIGTTMKQYNPDDPDNHTGVKPDCC